MLQQIKEKTSGIIATLIIILLVIVFALWGVSSYFAPEIENFVAKVNGEEILTTQYSQQLRQRQQQMRGYLGDSYNPEQYENLVFKRQMLDGIIRQKLISQAAEQSGFTVSSDELASEISAMQAFKGPSGVFDEEMYRMRLQQSGLNALGFEELLRKDLLTAQLPEALSDSSFVTEYEVNEILRLNKQLRSFNYFLIRSTDFLEGVEVTDDDIQAYYDSHPDLYLNQETVTINYIDLDLTAKSYLDTLDVSEESLRERFEVQKSRFVTDEQRLASHVLFAASDDTQEGYDAENSALAFIERVADGETFASLVSDYSTDPGSKDLEGDLGWVAPGMMEPEFETALFELAKAGDLSSPIKTKYGTHVILLREIQASKGKSFEDVRDELALEFKEAEAEKDFLEIAEQLIDLSYENAEDLEVVSDSLDLEIKTSQPFTQFGGVGFTAERKIIDAAFTDELIESGLLSAEIDLGPNRMAVIQVISHQKAERKPLDEIKTQVEAAAKREAAGKLAQDTAKEIVQAIESGTSFADAIGEDSELSVATDIERAGGGDVNFQVRKKAFELPYPVDGEPNMHQVDIGSADVAVVELMGVKEGDLDSIDDAERERIRTQLSRSFSQAEQEGFYERLKAKADIVIVEDKL